MKRIAIHSVPRSGSTWLGSIFDSHPNVLYRFQPLFSYALKDYLTPESTAKDIDNFFNELVNIKDDFIEQKEAKNKGIIPSFRKDKITTVVYKEVRYNHIIENMLEKDKKVKVIGLVRNPLAVLSSWYKAPREFRKDLKWDFNKEWQYANLKNQNKPEEFFGFEKWKQVTNLFEKLKSKYPKRFYLVYYQDLLLQTKKTIKTLFDFAELDFTKQTETFLVSSKTNHDPNVYSVFKKKNTDENWQTILPETIVEKVIMDLEREKLKKYIGS